MFLRTIFNSNTLKKKYFSWNPVWTSSKRRVRWKLFPAATPTNTKPTNHNSTPLTSFTTPSSLCSLRRHHFPFLSLLAYSEKKKLEKIKLAKHQVFPPLPFLPFSPLILEGIFVFSVFSSIGSFWYLPSLTLSIFLNKVLIPFYSGLKFELQSFKIYGEENWFRFWNLKSFFFSFFWNYCGLVRVFIYWVNIKIWILLLLQGFSLGFGKLQTFQDSSIC